MPDAPPIRPAHCRRCWHIISHDYDHPLLVKARSPGSNIKIICLACGCQQFTAPRPRVVSAACSNALSQEKFAHPI